MLRKTFSMALVSLLATRTRGYVIPRNVHRPRPVSKLFSSTSSDTETAPTPWNAPDVVQRVARDRKNNKTRFRQHVNPLARQYQQPTELSDEWPRDVFAEHPKPLHLDIGCGKGGFLLDTVKVAMEASSSSSLPYNYLGLEIRPPVAIFAKDRVPVHNATGVLDFLGCNVNVDLERLMERYHQKDDRLWLERVSIQYPDPHFKAQHAKRRVVTPALVETLARYMPTGAKMLLQSDIVNVLDDMRLRFRESVYFDDELESADDYLPDNPWGVPTERELSVVNKGLPVYRSMLTRNSMQVDVDSSTLETP